MRTGLVSGGDVVINSNGRGLVVATLTSVLLKGSKELSFQENLRIEEKRNLGSSTTVRGGTGRIAIDSNDPRRDDWVSFSGKLESDVLLAS